ncbi:MAG: Gfo/Idh/MocA family oxidoreductase [Desulfuromonadales bacterium]|nr:Gfo/Idh/MocA family oxidoreductase [Desulfuromonadales bacterium]
MLHIALVGCGRISERHAELLGNSQVAHARLAAVCDPDIDRARRLADRYGVPWYADMHELAAQEKDVDIISILTPSGLHAEHVIALAPYKKHLIVEKPMALSLDDADAMIRICDENGIKLFVIKQNRFNLPVCKLKEALNNKRFGKLVLGTIRVRWCRDQAYYDMDRWRGTWAFDGGVFANQASHHIDLLEWMMGDVESVFAKSITALVDIETEDTGMAVLKFRNGALGLIEATTATRPKDLEGSISILGEKGTVEIGGFAVNQMKTWSFIEKETDDDDMLANYSVNPPDVYGFGHKAYYEHVVDCILNNKKALIDGLEGRKSLELISAIYESIETGREVFLRFKPLKCKLGMK